MKYDTARAIVLSFVIATAMWVSGAGGSTPQAAGWVRLIGFDPLPDFEQLSDESTCAMPVPPKLSSGGGPATPEPLGAGGPVTAFQSSQSATSPSPGGGDAVAARKPLRWIQDPYPAFSAAVVDSMRNEVVLLDANRFDILVYDRLANAASGAAITEPKRKIGGQKTLSQFASSIHLDAANGDIYALNNDSLIGMNVFSRRANGNVAPDRHFNAPYGGFGLAVDDKAQELFLTIQHDSAVAVWPKGAEGDAHPVRSLQGSRTHLADPHGIALDLKNRLMYVTNFGTSRLAVPGTVGRRGAPRIENWPAGTQLYRQEVVPGSGHFGAPSVTVFPMDARGDTPPLRIIEGPKTGLSWPTGIAVDPEHGEVYVANDTGDSVTVYSATASGDVSPVRALKGPRALIKNPLGVFVDVVNDEVWVANYGNHRATVYRRTASGDAAPLRVIRSAPPDAPATMISNPYSIAYDPSRQEILVPS